MNLERTIASVPCSTHTPHWKHEDVGCQTSPMFLVSNMISWSFLMSLSLLPKDKEALSRSGNSEIDLGSFTLIIYALFSLKLKKKKKQAEILLSLTRISPLWWARRVCVPSPHCRTGENAPVRVLNLWSLSWNVSERMIVALRIDLLCCVLSRLELQWFSRWGQTYGEISGWPYYGM